MKVNETTRYADFAGVEKYLKPKAVEELKKAAERAYGQMYELTFARFLDCTNGDFGGVLGNLDDPTVLQIYWCKRFNDFAKEFAETLKNMQVPLTADEQQAGAGLPKQTFAEGMLVFIRGYFNLPSFKAAEQITMGEIVIAKRDTYINSLYTRKLHNIQLKKAKQRK